MFLPFLITAALASPQPGALPFEATGLAPGVDATFVVGGLAPSETAWLLVGRGPATAGPCPAVLGGLCLDMDRPSVLSSAAADATGVATLVVSAPATLTPGDAWTFQAVAVRGLGGGDTASSLPITHLVVDAQCGNGLLDPGEGCDDGALVDGDGCDATCTAEVCPVPARPTWTRTWATAASTRTAVDVAEARDQVLVGIEQVDAPMGGPGPIRITRMDADGALLGSDALQLLGSSAGVGLEAAGVTRMRDTAETVVGFTFPASGQGTDAGIARIRADGTLREVVAIDAGGADQTALDVVAGTEGATWLLSLDHQAAGDVVNVSKYDADLSMIWTRELTPVTTDTSFGAISASEAGGATWIGSGLYNGVRRIESQKFERNGSYGFFRDTWTIRAGGTAVDVWVTAADDTHLGWVAGGALDDPDDDTFDLFAASVRSNGTVLASTRLDLDRTTRPEPDLMVAPNVCRYTSPGDGCGVEGDACAIDPDTVCSCGPDLTWSCRSEPASLVFAWATEGPDADIRVARFDLGSGALLAAATLDSGEDDQDPRLSVARDGSLVIAGRTPSGTSLFRVDPELTSACATPLLLPTSMPLSVDDENAPVPIDTTATNTARFLPGELIPLAAPATEEPCAGLFCDAWP